MHTMELNVRHLGQVVGDDQLRPLPGTQAQCRADERAVVDGAHNLLATDIDRLAGHRHRRFGRPSQLTFLTVVSSASSRRPSAE